ncbi:DUF2516 family protein [Phycicoccus sp. BSK3Z-2]|uniref:DUF2516 family protein n=1 Tax=Phycicoccus avicenniae TaxID=2828860 RepID=A0A941D5N4_9MICO|nr:DUF2516 family protein [Phycicoccus avicenniae]MBR7741911.1 DUF2516 family protein [Phycicoccus avicenniae]
MGLLSGAQYWVTVVLSVAAFAVELYALVDCVRRRPDAFTAAGKRTKNFWLLVTGVAAVFGFVVLGSPNSLGIIGIIAVIAAGVYLADVKPALDQVMGRGGGSTQGPYGAW